MIDAHAHLTFGKLKKDLQEVINRAQENNVNQIISVATTLDQAKECIHLSEKYEEIFATVGIHPHHADKIEPNWIPTLSELADHKKVVAIGECGLDNYHYHSNGIVDMSIQLEVFETQIEIAYKKGLPLQIHNRLAWDEMLSTLVKNKNFLPSTPGLMHCISGSKEYVKKLLDYGFYIGFDGNVTYQNLAKGESTRVVDLLQYVPIDRMILETDSPFLSPNPHRNKRNEPMNVIIIAEFIAEKKKISLENLINQVNQNSKTLFKI